MVENLLIVPGYEDTLDCRDLLERLQMFTVRAKELERLKERSATGPGGTVASALAYDTDFAKARAVVRNATQAATRKGCDLAPHTDPKPPHDPGGPPGPKPPH